MSSSGELVTVMASCDETFDILVVGAGMFGSSCAKYLSQMSPNLRVALIGPAEPQDRADTEVTVNS